ncbi:MAG: serine hydrolase domain-containing protein [Brevundimonas sp.]
MRHLSLVVGLIALAMGLATGAGAQTASDGLEAVRSRLAADAGYAGVFGVYQNGEIVAGAVGQATPGRAHDVATPFRWASVSKMITAILVFQQVDADTIRLDTPLATYLPGTPIPNADRITVRQLLAHRSGLAGQADLPAGPPGDLIAYCLGVQAEPGTTFFYNNCDTIVLGKVLEAVSGSSYLDLVNRRIAEPLGFALSLPDEPRVEAVMEDGLAEAPVWPSGYGPAGGLYGTVEDLLRIDAALMDGRLMSAASREIMLTGDPASGYAALSVWSYAPDLGACLGQTRLVERYGEIGGVQVRNFLLLDRDIAVSVYSNDHRTGFGEVWRGEGLSIDLIRAAACGEPSTPAA